jgi:hypothetical protein
VAKGKKGAKNEGKQAKQVKNGVDKSGGSSADESSAGAPAVAALFASAATACPSAASAPASISTANNAAEAQQNSVVGGGVLLSRFGVTFKVRTGSSLPLQKVRISLFRFDVSGSKSVCYPMLTAVPPHSTQHPHQMSFQG